MLTLWESAVGRMPSALALNIPQRGPNRSAHYIALIDIFSGLLAFDIWGRLGWRDIKRRYRRTTFGPLWTTVSLGVFVAVLGLVWSNLWHMDPKLYLPYLTSGMLSWVLFSAICTEACSAIIASQNLLKQLRISYTMLACATVWRNLIVFAHNIIIFVLICIYARVVVSWATLLVLPGLFLLSLNGLWIALFLGAVCARYRDIVQLVASLLQIALFVTPILWDPSQLTGRASMLADYNPLYHMVEIVRDPLLGRAPAPTHWIVVAIITIIGWTVTVQMLSKFRHRIVYWL
jgi:ABC-type polysaccharide/polyol phosphate export permease